MATSAPVTLCMAAALAGCTGTIEGTLAEEGTPADEAPSGGPQGPQSPGGTSPAASCAATGRVPAPLRRLTNAEYDNTVRDLLGIDLSPADAFPKDGEIGGLTNNVAHQQVNVNLLGYYFSSAGRVAARALEGSTARVGCDPAAKGEQTCARQFIETMGLRAYRRPLEDSEKQLLFQAFETGRAGGDFKSGLQNLLEAMLVAPQFLFRTTEAATEGSSALALDGWGLASRLSYLLWSTMPDADLFEAARSGQIATKEGLLAQTDRLLADPRAREPMRRLHKEWLELDGLADLKKSKTAFPAFSDSLRASMDGEMDRFLDHVMWAKGRSLRDLLTSTDSFWDSRLAQFYGSASSAPGAFQPVTVDGSRRAGLLTKGGFLSAISKEFDSGLVHRGLFVRQRLLCQTVPDPPEDVSVELPPALPDQSTRQRFAQHQADPGCAACHRLMDPLGLSLENYDGIGAWRDKENGVAVDPSGELTGAAGGGPYRGAVELGRMLAGSATFNECATRTWFRYAFGRNDEARDACTIESLGRELAAAGQDEKGLIRALVQNDAFRFRR